MSASNARTSVGSNPELQDLVLTRVLDAPRDLVFKSWIEPARLAQWWGPHGFTNPVCEVDVRPGGTLRIVMRGPDGVAYPMRGVFDEIVEPERLVFTSALNGDRGTPILEVRNTVTFDEQADNQTLLTLRARVVTATAEAAPRLEGMDEGWGQPRGRSHETLIRAQPRGCFRSRRSEGSVL